MLDGYHYVETSAVKRSRHRIILKYAGGDAWRRKWRVTTKDEIVDDEDAICGWGAADFDDDSWTEVGASCQQGYEESPQKKLVSLKPGSVLPALHKQKQHQSHGAEPLPERQNQVTNLDPENQNEHRVHRKFKRNSLTKYESCSTTKTLSHRRERLQSKRRMLLLLLLDASDE
ncbi:hypothetical protein GQ600_3349 [Phytophthora cactorum]|nr:hypothetical protein GQ600_3349 [Phytophthora cactorum]